MKFARRAATWLAPLWIFVLAASQTLAACAVLPDWIPVLHPTPTAGSTPQATLSPAPGVDDIPTPRATSPVLDELTVWLPPEFDPEGQGGGAALLKQRLEAFGQANDVTVKVRLKALSGPGGMLESLTASAAAAPSALPSLVALSRADLESAALKGLITPLDGSTAVFEGEDWYEYARQLARVQSTTFGIPFAGDVMVIVYRPSLVSPSPASWESILGHDQPLGFPAANPRAMTTLALYCSAGGETVDAQGRPLLESAPLERTLALYSQAAAAGLLPEWVIQADSDAQVWQAYQDGLANIAITWSSTFLSRLPADSAALPLPAVSGGSLGLASAWSWAVTDPIPERRLLSIRLAEWLSEPTFLGAWTAAAGYIPTRPSALAGWRDGSLKAVFSQIALSARAVPTNDQLSSLGPVLRDAAVSVIRLELPPGEAAQTAAQRVSAPPQP